MPQLTDALVQLTRPLRAQRGGEVALGTGFWFRVGAAPPRLATSAHVVDGAERVAIATAGGRWTLARAVLRHPDPEVDLALLELDGPAPAAWLEGGWIPHGAAREALAAVEPILALGHPLGLFDPEDPRPIARSGVTATDPRRPWRGRAEFLVDLPCHPGTSGSPVLRYRPEAEAPIALLGVLVGGPALREEARVGALADWPRGDTFHLGTAVDARHLLAFA